MTDLDLTTRTHATYDNSHFETIFGIVAGVLMAATIWQHQTPQLTLGWLGLCIFIYGARFVIARSYLKTRRATSPAWLAVYTVGAALAGVVWGLAGWTMASSPTLFPAGIVTYWIALAIVSAGLIYAGSFTAICVFIVTATVPTIAGLLRLNTLEMQVAATMVGFLGVLVIVVGRFISKRHLNALSHESNIHHLAQLLDQRRNQVDKLNVALKTNADKREQAEQTVRKLSADLGLAESKTKALSETLARVSTLCNVTELNNRKHFAELVDTEWRRNLREKRAISVIVFCFDDYEAYLETNGRQGTDAMLKKVSKLIKGFGRRAGDEGGRYDDDKLSLLLPGADTKNAARIAEAIRRRIESQQIQHTGAPNRVHLTVHVGVATMIPSTSIASAELFKRVETAMYEAQFRGGNRVVVYQALEKLKIERWNSKTDGDLNEGAMLQKMLVWGLEPERFKADAGAEVMAEDTLVEEYIFGLLSGTVRIVVEGQEVELKAGEVIFIPVGVTASALVSSATPALYLKATRNEVVED